MAVLNFKGKPFVQNHHLTVKYRQLVPKKDKGLTNKVSLNDNLIIHGDNLKALKALLPTYAGKVKCIYIDPPYNTGNEKWAYNDNVNSPMMQDWLGKVVDTEDLTRHDKWLCMMMPRLKLLRELLAEDGVVCISIDDVEIGRLVSLMDETFGEVGLSDGKNKLLKEKGVAHKEGGLELDYTFVARQMLDIVPNPWIAYDIGKRIIKTLISKYDEKIAANNLAFIIEESRKRIEKERDRLAEGIFRELVEKKVLCFFLIAEKGGCKLPSRMKVKNNTIPLSSFIQQSLFEFAPGEGFNDMEKSIALYLDGQEKLLWWYRNLSRQDYYVQGWKKYRIYPDFIFADNDEKREDYSTVFVIETKGTHLKNDDTTYKKNVFAFCNKLGARKDWKELNMEFADRRFEFQVVFGDEWKARINEFFREGAAS